MTQRRARAVFEHPYLFLAAAIVCFAVASVFVGNGAQASTGTPVAATPTDDPRQALRPPLDVPIPSPGGVCPQAPARMVTPAFGALWGDGPVYAAADSISSGQLLVVAVGGATDATPDSLAGWFAQKVLWVVDPSYPGPILVRGVRLDGPGEMLLALNNDAPGPELRIGMGRGAVAVNVAGSPTAAGWASWPSLTYVPAPGCYAWQIDGEGFSQTIVVRATVVSLVGRRAGEPDASAGASN